MISSFRRVQNVVCFLLGDSPASDLYMPTFRNTLSVPSSKAGVKYHPSITSHLPLKMEQIVCSETSAYINQTPGNHLKENKNSIILLCHNGNEPTIKTLSLSLSLSKRHTSLGSLSCLFTYRQKQVQFFESMWQSNQGDSDVSDNNSVI